MGKRIAAKALIIIALHLNFTSVCASTAPDESGTFNFLWENDAIAGTDHHYTNGVELSYLSIEDHLWDWFRNGSNLLPGVNKDDHVRVGLALGQSIFTPDDTQATQPLPDQRPYAGWLYLGVAVVANRRNETRYVGAQSGCRWPVRAGRGSTERLSRRDLQRTRERVG